MIVFVRREYPVGSGNYQILIASHAGYDMERWTRQIGAPSVGVLIGVRTGSLARIRARFSEQAVGTNGWFAETPELRAFAEEGDRGKREPGTGFRLRPDEVREIFRRAWETYDTDSSIGRAFGVTEMTVSRIARGEGHPTILSTRDVPGSGGSYEVTDGTRTHVVVPRHPRRRAVAYSTGGSPPDQPPAVVRKPG